MKRVLVGILAAVLAAGLVVSGAEAQKRKKKAHKHHESKVPTSEKIGDAMTGLKWGMSKDELMHEVTNRLKEKYRPLLAKAKGAVEEDRIRRKARDELDAVKKSYVEFDGRSSGWDASFLKGEFRQNNDESMLVVRDGNSQNFYFFLGGQLWKWYKAFDASVFPAGNFKVFASAVQHRFGPAKESKGDLGNGEGKHQWLEWQDKNTRLRAVDQTDFYGFYCLVFDQKDTAERLAKIQTDTGSSENKTNAFVEAVTSDHSGRLDDSSNIADRISGRIRQREQAPEETASTASSGRSAKSSAKKGRADDSSSSESSGSGVSEADDPLAGLGM